MEKEIENILASIEHKDLSDIKTFDEIKYIRNKVLDDVFKDFMDYKLNLDNREKHRQTLEEDECTYVTPDELERNDIVYFIDMFVFYNIKLVKGRFVSIKDKEPLINIEVEEDGVYKAMPLDTIIFKKLGDEDKAKLSLVEYLQK